MTRNNNTNTNNLEFFTKYNEVELKRLYEPNPGIFVAESAYVIERALNASYIPVSILIEESNIHDNGTIANTSLTLEDSRFENAEINIVSKEIMSTLKGYEMTRGTVCAMLRKPLPDYTEIIGGARRIAILESVMNPTNLGAIFRSAAALNIDAIIISGKSTDPLYRRAARVSMGTVFQIPWTVYKNKKDSTESGTVSLIKEIKGNGFTSVAMALDDKAVPLNDESLKNYDKLAIVLGSEGYGLENKTIEICDHTVIIPMSAGVDSLNVAAASAVAFWELSK